MVTSPPPVDYGLRLEVETPEHVLVDYELAGLGSRALAAIIDTIIVAGLMIAVVLVAINVFPGRVAAVLLVLGQFALIWGYYALFEGLRQGQTPGKRLTGLRVIRDTGHPVTLRDAVARNLLRFADFLPPPYLLGGLMVAFHPRAKRLGDLVAGTVVVRDRPADATLEALTASKTDAETELGPPRLSDAEFRVLREFTERGASLETEVRRRIAATLVPRFEDRVPVRGQSDLAFLSNLYAEELARRRGRFGARVASNAPGATHGGSGQSVAERLVARKGARWREFAHLAERVSTNGLDALTSEELPDFARRYREIAADLARARTYRADRRILLMLERLVAAGHNALYRDERHTIGVAGQFLIREAPASVWRNRTYVLISFLTFTLPALGSYAALRAQPELAERVLPAVMLDRAQEGVERQARGEGYFEAGPSSRPFIATAIITNNVRVAFVCFATGIFFGVGSLAALAFNGLAIGAASGHFANSGLLGYLWTFVIGHGVLELFAIWVAGAAGLMLGRAIIAPGELARRDALVVQGREAMAMIAFVVVLLLLAGLVEGFLSASRAPIAARVGVSAASAVVLVAYLWSGARQERGKRKEERGKRRP